MAITLTFKNPNLFTSDNPNLIKLESTNSGYSDFHYRVETYKGVTLLGTDKVFVAPTGETLFDMSIYTRYSTGLNSGVNSYSVKVYEVINGVIGVNSTINKSNIVKGWLTDYETNDINTKGITFLNSFKNNYFDSSLLGEVYIYTFSNANYKVRVRLYNESGNIIYDLTSTLSPSVFRYTSEYINNTSKVIYDLYTTADVLVDTITFEQIKECSNVVLRWVSRVGGYEVMPLTHNTVPKSNINKFSYENEGENVYLKTWKDGGTIYSQDLDDENQRRIEDVLKSPLIELFYKDEKNNVRQRKITVSNLSWQLNQTYYEDAKAAIIDFEFTELEKSILL